MNRYDYLKVNFLKRLVPVLGPICRTSGNLRILSYHSIDDSASLTYNTSQKDFRDQMQFLVSHAFRFISAGDLIHKERFLAGEQYILLTFDDGFLNNYEIAMSVLHEMKIPAIFFINTSYIDEERNNSIPPENNTSYPDLTLMNWKQVRELSDNGFTIGSHGHTHRTIARLDEKEQEKEVRSSIDLISSKTGKKVFFFSYPYGTRNSYSRLTMKILARNDIRFAFTERWGAVDIHNAGNPYRLARVPILGYDDIEVFHHKLQGKYDFLRHLTA
jgi:peptidoglycan/xylan/chitin deacetylase (PgdA/CDA1 family)